ncbi:MAG: mechanosensitive ion channel family protein [Deltaproteobacteria bacterium]|nr:mechanosensitive ion channel family protein [Deltaproteobacteria bacterium]
MDAPRSKLTPSLLRAVIAAGIVSLLVAAGVQARPPPSLSQVLKNAELRDGGTEESAPPPRDEPGLPGSPRSTLKEWLRFCLAGNFVDAARFLDVPEEQLERGPELARRLKAVLDRYAAIDLAKLSGHPDGDTGDGLPHDEELVARVPGPSGATLTVRLVHERSGDLGWWRFDRETVEQIDPWYSTLRNRWLIDILPAPLLRMGPAGVLYWQWLALCLLLVGAFVAALVLARLTQAGLLRLARRTAPPWDDRIVENIFGPLTMFWAVGLFSLFLPLIGLLEAAHLSVAHLEHLAFVTAVLWLVMRAVSELTGYLHESDWAKASPASRALIPLGSTLTKLLVVFVGLISLLSELGYSVSSIVAGLGIGGLALAFGAQKTVENLFGALSIGIDQPFRAGDVVRVEDSIGTVEVIGLRSTRIRTADRTIITIPNGKLAELKIESLAARDRFRFYAVLGLTYATKASQLRAVISAIELLLRQSPKVWPEVQVVLLQFGPSSLDIEVSAWIQAKDSAEFAKLKQELLFQILETVEREGSSFAFPTRSVQLLNPVRTQAVPDDEK